MNKVKDLITVSVLNAVRSFKSDKERYELLVGVRSWVASSVNSDWLNARARLERDFLKGTPRDDSYRNVESYVMGTHENLTCAAKAYVRYMQAVSNGVAGQLPDIVQDRALRLMAGCDDLEYENLPDIPADLIDDACSLYDYALTVAWSKLLMELIGYTCSAVDFSLSDKGAPL